MDSLALISSDHCLSCVLVQANGEQAAPVAPVASDTAMTDQDVHCNGQQTLPVDPEVDIMMYVNQTRHLIPYELAQQVDLNVSLMLVSQYCSPAVHLKHILVGNKERSACKFRCILQPAADYCLHTTS